MLGTFAEDAVFDMVSEQKQAKLIEGRTKCGDLSEDINAVALLVDHLLNSADLTGYSGETLLGVGVGIVTHSTIITKK